MWQGDDHDVFSNTISLAFLKAKGRPLKSSYSVGCFSYSPRDICQKDGKSMKK